MEIRCLSLQFCGFLKLILFPNLRVYGWLRLVWGSIPRRHFQSRFSPLLLN